LILRTGAGPIRFSVRSGEKFHCPRRPAESFSQSGRTRRVACFRKAKRALVQSLGAAQRIPPGKMPQRLTRFYTTPAVIALFILAPEAAWRIRKPYAGIFEII